MRLMTVGLLRDPVCHEGDREDIQSWPRPLPVVRGPDAVNDRPSVEEAEKK